ncbi:MAG: hypothetical protein IKJ88_06580 [Clostridia bacterium]|nr:hypothetical protein [Clostridia bacterium]
MDKIKNFFLGEIKALKEDLNIVEYISWWLLRFFMVGVIIYMKINDPENINIYLVTLNIVATFTIPLVRLILFPKKLICRLSYRTQTMLNILICLGSLCGQGLSFNHKISNWDKFLHLLAGAVVVFIGNELINVFLKKDDKIPVLVRSFAAAGFSYAAVVIWELVEFFADYYWAGSCNQAYNITPDPDMLFFKIFGLGVQNEGQFAVFDTNVDMLLAFIGNIFASIVLAVYLHKKEQKKAQLVEKQAVTV